MPTDDDEYKHAFVTLMHFNYLTLGGLNLLHTQRNRSSISTKWI